MGIDDEYDSLEDPQLKSDYLDALGITRAVVEAARRHRAAAAERTAEEGAGPSSPEDRPRGSGRSRLRDARRKALRGGAGTHPRNRSDTARRVRSRRSRPTLVVFVMVFPGD